MRSPVEVVSLRVPSAITPSLVVVTTAGASVSEIEAMLILSKSLMGNRLFSFFVRVISSLELENVNHRGDISINLTVIVSL